jgi:hypothetical protein
VIRSTAGRGRSRSGRTVFAACAAIPRVPIVRQASRTGAERLADHHRRG